MNAWSNKGGDIWSHHFSFSENERSQWLLNFHMCSVIIPLHWWSITFPLIPHIPSWMHKVNRSLARYSPRTKTTHQPANRASHEPARPICTQESIFGGKNGRFWAKYPNYFGREQKFWYPHIRKPPRHLIRIVFCSASKGQKGQCLAQNYQSVYFKYFHT